MSQTFPSGAPAAAKFAHVRDWIFDLDNTLYRADNGIFAQIDGRMTSFVAEFLALDRDAARQVQKQLYRDHGTTLAGLIAVHGIDPEPYLAFVHDLDLSALQPDPAMIEALARLQGRRFVFTNGCRNHAARILERRSGISAPSALSPNPGAPPTKPW
jgi:putative hydrolase of the HAD superfamily